jgi:pyruvate/2-oxoglutarate dehydrogenase complex dihydrolipoamide dehydrogenase (E3) component
LERAGTVPRFLLREVHDFRPERSIIPDSKTASRETRRVQGHSGEDVSVLVRTSSGEQTIEGSDILVAAGRSPNTAGIGLC